MARLTKGICFSITEDEPDDEKNLLYVAVTRAKQRLQLPTMLYRLLVMKTVCHFLLYVLTREEL